jgi:hypothetical protein
VNSVARIKVQFPRFAVSRDDDRYVAVQRDLRRVIRADDLGELEAKLIELTPGTAW